MKFMHLRYGDLLPQEDGNDKRVVYPNGGVTFAWSRAESQDPANKGKHELTVGVAICALEDNFRRDKGRAKAQGRSKSKSAFLFYIPEDTKDSQIARDLAANFVAEDGFLAYGAVKAFAREYNSVHATLTCGE
jgi:hypothetical protein